MQIDVWLDAVGHVSDGGQCKGLSGILAAEGSDQTKTCTSH